MLVATLILIMILATIAVAALVLAPRLSEGRIIYDVAPDTPKAFGYGMAWLAIRTRDSGRVIEALALREAQSANWNTGLGTVYSTEIGPDRLFVTPPVNGWTFVVGLSLPQPLGQAFADKATPLLVDLGGTFIEVQYFAACPAIDYFAWARVIDGKLVRAFAVSDEGLLWNKGKVTKEEKAISLKPVEGRTKSRRTHGDTVVMPSEQDVMRLAAKWSLDPTRIDAANGDGLVGKGLGVVGRAPFGWRPERLRRTG